MAMVYKLGYNIPKKEINKRVFEYPKLVAQIQALTADKDEQARRIMQMDSENKKLKEGLRQAKADLQVAQNFSHPNGFKTIRKAINSIDALLGGKEDA